MRNLLKNTKKQLIEIIQKQDSEIKQIKSINDRNIAEINQLNVKVDEYADKVRSYDALENAHDALVEKFKEKEDALSDALVKVNDYEIINQKLDKTSKELNTTRLVSGVIILALVAAIVLFCL